MSRLTCIQSFVIAPLCVVAILAAPWFGNCSCAVAAAGPNCQCAVPADKSCCAAENRKGSATCTTANCCDSSCECATHVTDAAVAVEIRFDNVVAVADFSTIGNVTIDMPKEAVRRDGRDPPALSSARRRAMLSVWLN